jgi:hypothetical protein
MKKQREYCYRGVGKVRKSGKSERRKGLEEGVMDSLKI